MRKIVATIVVTALIGTLVSWVPYAYTHHQDNPLNVTAFDADTSHQHSENSTECDHCCHFGSHIVGLAIVATPFLNNFDVFAHPPLQSWPPSHEAVPPGPPPKHLV